MLPGDNARRTPVCKYEAAQAPRKWVCEDVITFSCCTCSDRATLWRGVQHAVHTRVWIRMLRNAFQTAGAHRKLSARTQLCNRAASR